MNVLSLKNGKEGVSLILDMDFKMKFEGGNQVRSEFDMTLCHCFIFLNASIPYDFKSPIIVEEQSFQDDFLNLKINGKKIRIKDTLIKVIANVRPYKDNSIG